MLAYLALVCCSDGQTIAVRLNKQVKKASSAIRKGVTAYNSVRGFIASAGATLPGSIDEKEVSSTSSIFRTILDISQVVYFNTYCLNGVCAFSIINICVIDVYACYSLEQFLCCKIEGMT